MSGIEVVALVIGLWPILSNGISAYKAVKDGRPTGDAQRKIQLYRGRFRRLAEKLLLGDEELTEADRCRLTIPGDGDISSAWSDKGLQDRMMRRLGPETYELIISVTGRILELLRSLEMRLDEGEVDISTFRGRLRGSVHHIKANRPHSRLQLELAKVKDYLDELSYLIEASPDPAYEGQDSVGRPRRLSTAVKKQKRLAAQLFDDFHDVLVGSYRCHCIHGHEANLRVYDDDGWFEILFVVEEEAERALSVQSQQTLSPEIVLPEDSGPESIASGSPVVGAADGSLEFLNGCWSSSRLASEEGGRKRKTLPLIFSVDRHGSNSPPISNLCQFVRTLDRSPPNWPSPIKPIGTLSDGDRSYTARLESSSVDSLGACVVCLEDCLSGGQDLRLSNQKRFDLAQNLAGFLLQVHATKWIDEAWTWRSFSIKDDGDDKRPQLFVSRTFFSEDRGLEEQQAKPSVFWRYIHQQPLLVRLAFALIELGMNKRLYELRDTVKNCDLSDGTYTEDEKDYKTALWLLEHGEIRREVSKTYHSVVEACLRYTVLLDTGAGGQTSRVDTLHDYLERFIVGPLKDHFMRNWGEIVGLEA